MLRLAFIAEACCYTMSRYKASGRLFGAAVDESDDEEEELELDDGEEDGEEEDEEEAADEAAAAGLTQEEKAERAKKRRWDREWEEQHFISRRKDSNGKTIYHTTLVEGLSFFSREEMVEFTKGKRYKRLLHDMKVGMRTHNDNEKLRVKAEARRERVRARREAKRKESRKKQRTGQTPDDIEAKKAKFQEKKARRLARKAAAGT